MLLDPRQRLVFMEFCKSEAESRRIMAEQMEKIAVMPQMVLREKQKAAAFSIVALELASAHEEFSVKSEDIGDVTTDYKPDQTEIANPGFRWEKK